MMRLHAQYFPGSVKISGYLNDARFSQFAIITCSADVPDCPLLSRRVKCFITPHHARGACRSFSRLYAAHCCCHGDRIQTLLTRTVSFSMLQQLICAAAPRSPHCVGVKLDYANSLSCMTNVQYQIAPVVIGA